MEREPSGQRRCVFCGGGPLTNEHIWPRWVGEVLADEGPFPVERTDTASWVANTIDMRVRRVCAPCNNGWMSKLEQRVQPVLRSMVVAEQLPVVLSPADQHRLAFWATKSAFILDLGMPDGGSVPAVMYPALMNGRNPPGQTAVWIAGYVGQRYTTFGRKRPLGLSGHLPGLDRRSVPADGEPETENAWAFTFTLGDMAFQVLGFTVDDNVALRPDAPDGPIARIWPLTGRPLSWPPNRAVLDDDGLIALAERVNYV